MPIVDAVRAAFPALPEKDPRQMAPLVLAYIGDTVYDLYMRTRLVLKTDSTAHGLHMAAAKLVCAAAQAAAYRHMADALTEEETAVFKRGRNAHMGTVPKNASIADYRAATGLEALMGYLYLCGRDERIEELMSLALKED